MRPSLLRFLLQQFSLRRVLFNQLNTAFSLCEEKFIRDHSWCSFFLENENHLNALRCYLQAGAAASDFFALAVPKAVWDNAVTSNFHYHFIFIITITRWNSIFIGVSQNDRVLFRLRRPYTGKHILHLLRIATWNHGILFCMFRCFFSYRLQCYANFWNLWTTPWHSMH